MRPPGHGRRVDRVTHLAESTPSSLPRRRWPRIQYCRPQGGMKQLVIIGIHLVTETVATTAIMARLPTMRCTSFRLSPDRAYLDGAPSAERDAHGSERSPSAFPHEIREPRAAEALEKNGCAFGERERGCASGSDVYISERNSRVSSNASTRARIIGFDWTPENS